MFPSKVHTLEFTPRVSGSTLSDTDGRGGSIGGAPGVILAFPDIAIDRLATVSHRRLLSGFPGPQGALREDFEAFFGRELELPYLWIWHPHVRRLTV